MIAQALLLAVVLTLGWFLGAARAAPLDQGRVWRLGWGEHPPFEYQSRSGVLGSEVVGLDVQLLRAVVELQLGGTLVAEPAPQPIDKQIAAIRQGRVDVIVDMDNRPEHRSWARLSDPYRQLEMVVLARAVDPGPWFTIRSVPQLLAQLQRSTARVGLIETWSYGPELDRWFSDPARASRCRVYGSAEALAEAVQEGQVNLGLGERLSLASALWGPGQPDRFRRLAIAPDPFLLLSSHFLFSPRTVSGAEVQQFNRALATARQSGAFQRIVRTALFPVLLEFSAGQWWYYPVELVGVFAAVLTGAVLALRAGFSVVGLVIVAILTAVGGGLLRDVLINRPVPSVFQSPIYMELVYLAVGLVALVALLARPLLESRRLDRWLDAVDAIGIAAFTVTGVLIALRMHAEPLLLWGPLLSVLTAGGGLLAREVILGRGEQALRPGILYHEISFGGSLLFSLFLTFYSGHTTYRLRDIEAAVVLTMVAVALLRLAAIHWGWRSPVLPGSRPTLP